MSAETRPGVSADHRSIIPWIPGVPWWAAVVISVTGCAVGFAFDAGSGKELTTVFSALYVVGCAAAILVVRQSGIFTAVIQPPLVLFCTVPGSYWLFHGAKYTGIKDLLINCGYPLIERFPLMLFTSAGVLLVGLVRWYLGITARPRAAAAAEATEVAGADAASQGGRLGLATRLMSFLSHASTDDGAADKAAKSRARRGHAVERSARSASADRGRTSRSPAAASRARRPRPPLDARPPMEDGLDPARRRRPTRPRDSDAAEPPRRGRLPRDPDLRGRPPREIRRDPHARGGRPAGRSSRFDPYEPVEPFEAAPPPAPRRRPMANGATATHHPISQVRYRTSNGAEEHNEPTSRVRRPRTSAADSWDLDN